MVKEIRKDFVSGKQMNRLLQGDVGSGKTIVAFLCMLMAIDNGSQACIMAPTEILAGQHYEGLKGFMDSLGLKIALLTVRFLRKNVPSFTKTCFLANSILSSVHTLSSKIKCSSISLDWLLSTNNTVLA